ncbi:hypothetical protein L596_030700 [Steinernema carpocapsae]|uniref:Uncharacterized protein n=1 Tax=Steinernema carpocapsae TaxID=34508 RepID=A0A4U5LNH2_STECR|nr:hypothetical protein L596_030700 [Steinernema carpocapsae]
MIDSCGPHAAGRWIHGHRERRWRHKPKQTGKKKVSSNVFPGMRWRRETRNNSQPPLKKMCREEAAEETMMKNLIFLINPKSLCKENGQRGDSGRTRQQRSQLLQGRTRFLCGRVRGRRRQVREF